MPGIVGLITKGRRCEAEAQLRAMLKAIQHEEFYSSGAVVDEVQGAYVGWTALKGSFSDCMPLKSEKAGFTLVFSGEEYPDPAQLSDLRNRGHFIDTAPAGYLIPLYEQDPDFVRGLNGMFHGLVIDRRRDILQLFNDRYGMHPLYYYQSADTFYFATEAKAILAVRPELREIDPQGFGEFVTCSCVLENRTIFKKIHALPAASIWRFRGARLESKGTFFNPKEWETLPPTDTNVYFLELRDVLTNVLPRYFTGSDQLGMAMTGGLDTRVILSNYPARPGALRGYTFGSKYRDTYDLDIGRRVAATCRQPHQVITVGDEFLNAFPRYAERTVLLTEGTVDLYRASDLYLSEKVRHIAPAKVVGTYGSEIIRHAVMFKSALPPEGLFNSEFLTNIRASSSTYSRLREEHPITFAAFRQSPWYHHGILALEQSQLTVRSPFMDNAFVRAAYRAPVGSAASDDVRIRLIKEANPALGRIRSDRGAGGNGTALGGMLARLYRELTFKAEYAFDYGMPQTLARIDHNLSWLHMERLFVGRHKLLHFRQWYRDELSEYVREILLDSRTLARPFLEPKAVRAIVDGHTKQGLNYTTAIQKLLTIELLHRLFFDPQ
jgi:asparagine synthase (glutamine-hydrolysing)